MKDVFSRASRFIVWLGEDDDEKAQTVLEIIEKVVCFYCKEAGVDTGDGVDLETVNPDIFQDLGRPLLNSYEWNSWIWFCRR